MLRTLCVLCVSAGPRCSASLWRLRVLCGWGRGSCTCPCYGVLVVLPSCCAPPPSLLWPLHCRTLGRTGCAAQCAALRAGAAAVLLLVLLWRCYCPLRPTPAPVPIEGLWGWCTLEQFSSSSRAEAGSNCAATAVLSLPLPAACPCPVTNQEAIGVTPGLGDLLVVGGPGPGARPPMGGLLSCLAAPRPPWCCGCSWGGWALALSPSLGGRDTASLPPIGIGRVVHGPCCAVLRCAVPCRAVQ